jgi:3'(2'), 5'-bisphosphate nucleotidase
MKDLLDLAIEASLKAGDAILNIYEQDTISSEIKDDNSPLTQADIASHETIMEYLNTTSIPVLSEEGRNIPYKERSTWELLWIVDPLDGTKEFIKRNGEFTVNIALIRDHMPILGVVYAPAIKELYFAESSLGAFKITGVDSDMSPDYIQKASTQLPVRNTDRPFTVVASRSHLSEETSEFIEQLRKQHGEIQSISKGSSLKLCMVADGSADCYPRFAPTMEWDTAAGHTICKYAGYKVTDRVTEKEMIYNRENLLNNWFLVH